MRTNFYYASSYNVLPTLIQTGAGNGALSANTAITYDALSDALTVDGPLSGTADTTRYRYDANRQIVGVVGPDPDGGGSLKYRAVRYSFNADGQSTSVEQGTVNGQSDSDWAAFASLAQVTSSYDTIGRRVRDNFVANSATHSVTQYSYTAVNTLECAAVRLNPSVFGSLPSSACALGTAGAYGNDHITKTLYDAADQVSQVKDAFGTSLEQTAATFTYSNNGLQSTFADAKGNLTTFEYDDFDRLNKMLYPTASNGSVSNTSDYEQYTYDKRSGVTQVRRRDGQAIATTYDRLGRATLVDAPSGNDDFTATYDNFGRPLTQSSGGNTLTMVYDGLGRTTSVAAPQGTTSYQYDIAGRRTRMTWPDSFYVTYDVDLLGEVTAIRENGAGSGVGVLATYQYDNLGHRTSLTRGNGNSTTLAYDTATRLATMVRDVNSTGSDQTSGFTWNAASQQMQQTVSNTALVAPAPSAATTSYTSNGLNQYSAVGGTSLTYTDARGNLTYDGVKTYGFDIYNRLTTASGGGTFGYDPASRLSVSSNGATSTYFGYDGVDMVGEYNGSGALLRRYVHGPGSDEPLVWYEGSGTSDRRFLIADELGSIATVADASGAALANNTYTEFGAPGGSNTGRFQYTGQTWLPEAGLYNYKARVYSAALGRFLQTDPIGFGGGVNLYAYVWNDPINFIDSWGLRQGFQKDEDEIPVIGLRLCRDSTTNCSPADPNDRLCVGPTCARPYVNTTPSAFDPPVPAVTDEVVVTADRRAPACIKPSDGPVMFRGGGLDLVLAAGLGFHILTFETPQGGRGVVATGAGLVGLGGSAGLVIGQVNRIENFLGPGARLDFEYVPAIGLGLEVIQRVTGEPSGYALSYGGGGGLYGGRTQTTLLSSNVPLCGTRVSR